MVADGHLGIWTALAEIFPEVEEQRCWNHKLITLVYLCRSGITLDSIHTK